MISIMQAARYFIYLSYGDNPNSLTPLKLQKLLYLSQGWSFVWDNKPLFAEQFEAWQYGPVNRLVYSNFNKYGRNNIPESEAVFDFDDKEAKDTILAVWRDYSRYSSFQLVNITHSQDPWIKAFNSNQIISNDEIKDYFINKYKMI